jgi:peptidoglycan/xylan/chitin deacetylase (PgdA/CDA1 family)
MAEIEWPDGRSCAVAITVNCDAQFNLLALDGTLADARKTLSGQLYGITRGTDRLLDLFAAHGVTATWFLPGEVAAAHPRTVERIRDAGQCIGMRANRPERLDVLDHDERAAALDEALSRFATLGIVPRGFRLPAGEWPFGLVDQLVERDIRWSSSWVGDDLPFALRGSAERGIVEIPVAHALDDRQSFSWNFAPAIPPGHSRIASYRQTLATWVHEIEGVREHGLCAVLQLSPETVATPGRIGLVAELLDRLGGDRDVWLPTCDDLATWWSARYPTNRSGHPADLFLELAGRAGY